MEIKVQGQVRLECRDKDGNLKWDSGWIKNGITNTGFAQLAGLASNIGGFVGLGYIGVGTSNTAFAASQTTLVAEITDTGLARAAATVSRVTTTQTNDTLQLTYTWTASGSKTVEEVGIFTASSGGIMLGRALTTSKVLSNTDQFTATYQVKFS